MDTILNTPMYYSEEESVKQVVMVDRSAVHKDDNGSYVYILNDGILQKRYVLCGLSNVDHVWIIDGLTEGQTLVLN